MAELAPMGQSDSLDVNSLDGYVSALRQDLAESLMTNAEFDAALRALGIAPELDYSFHCFNADPNQFDQAQVIRNLAVNYYREVFDEIPETIDENTPGIEVLLGEEKGRMRGAIWLAQDPTLGLKGCTYVRRLYVRPEYRGTGLGSMLLYHTLESASGSDSIVLHAWEKSVPFYHRNGFLKCDEEERVYGQVFYKMVLPLTKTAFEHYQLEKAGGWFDGLAEFLTHLEWSRFITAVDQMKGQEEPALSQNPFTFFIHKNLGWKHQLSDPVPDQE